MATSLLQTHFFSVVHRQPASFREVAVDPQVMTPSGQPFDVLFVGTNHGKILKIVNTADVEDYAKKPVFVEEIGVFPKTVSIRKLQVVRTEREVPRLLIMTSDELVSIPVSRCGVAKHCHVCVGLKDPYCAWDNDVGRCTNLYDEAPTVNAAAFLQNVVTGVHKYFYCLYPYINII